MILTVDGGNDERVRRHGGVVEGVEGLQGAGEPVQEGRARPGVGEGVHRGRQVVEGEPPVGQHGEVGEAVAGLLAPAEGFVRAVPARSEELDEDAIEALWDEAGWSAS